MHRTAVASTVSHPEQPGNRTDTQRRCEVCHLHSQSTSSTVTLLHLSSSEALKALEESSNREELEGEESATNLPRNETGIRLVSLLFLDVRVPAESQIWHGQIWKGCGHLKNSWGGVGGGTGVQIKLQNLWMDWEEEIFILNAVILTWILQKQSQPWNLRLAGVGLTVTERVQTWVEVDPVPQGQPSWSSTTHYHRNSHLKTPSSPKWQLQSSVSVLDHFYQRDTN